MLNSAFAVASRLLAGVCCRGGLAIASLLLSLTSVGAAGPTSRPPHGEDKPAYDEDKNTTVSRRGFVFIDGQYVAPPYRIEESEQGVRINGRAVSIASPASTPTDAQRPPRFRWQAGRGGDFRRRAPFEPGSRNGRKSGREAPAAAPPKRNQRGVNRDYVAANLEVDGILVSRPETFTRIVHHPQQIHEILGLLIQNGQGSATDSSTRPNSAEAPQGLLIDWFRDFQPSADLVRRASDVVAGIEEGMAAETAGERALQRLSRFAFPLTLLGMILSFVASGHLVSHPPHPLDEETSEKRLRIQQRATVVSIGLLIALSGLDLVWTLLTSQAGQMVEVNPLASQLVEDPFRLIAFKVTMTLGSCAILFALRDRQAARLASWWLCLALTLLTFRWLVFHSLQVA